VDRGQHATCCRSADPEIVQSEPEVFDCEACEFRQRVDGLGDENADAWRYYVRLTGHRWLWDMQGADWWLGQVFGACDEDERDDVMARIDVIYDALHPRQEKPRGA